MLLLLHMLVLLLLLYMHLLQMLVVLLLLHVLLHLLVVLRPQCRHGVAGHGTAVRWRRRPWPRHP